MTSESFGCHDISRHRSGVGLPDGRAAASACRRGVPRSLWWLPASSGRTARGWDATGRGSGALRIGGAFVQYAQPLASGSRPSWSRPTRADSGRSRRRVIASRPQRRRRAGSGGADLCGDAGLCRKNPGLTPARPGVHSADMTEPAAEAPGGNRWNSAVLHRHAVPIRGQCQRCGHRCSTRPLPFVPSSAPGPPACPRFPPERMSQK